MKSPYARFNRNITGEIVTFRVFCRNYRVHWERPTTYTVCYTRRNDCRVIAQWIVPGTLDLAA